jgi:hypothetical protein
MPTDSSLADCVLPIEFSSNGGKVVDNRLQPKAINEILSSLADEVAVGD